jgi:hypothetical protein
VLSANFSCHFCGFAGAEVPRRHRADGTHLRGRVGKVLWPVLLFKREFTMLNREVNLYPLTSLHYSTVAVHIVGEPIDRR